MALRARGLILALVGLALAGCGGGGGSGPAAGAVASPAASPDPLYAKAKACGIPTSAPFPTPEGLAPFLLEPYVTTITSPSGAGYRSVIFTEKPATEMLTEIKRVGAERGLEETFAEQEPYDAEVNLRDPDGAVTVFKLLTLQSCNNATQITVVRLQG